MPVDASILESFFEECDDLIMALTDGLADMAAGRADHETVNAVFRSVHSIKGAAGAFAMEELVNFAHRYEAVLDALRNNTLTADEELHHLLQRAGDVLAELVDAAREDRSVDPDQVEAVAAELDAQVGAEGGPAQEFVFEALTLDFGEEATGPRDYRVSFTPTRAFYAAGNDPLMMIRALAELGPCETTVTQVNDWPADIAGFDWEDGHLRWEVLLSAQDNTDAIHAIFQFADDLCDLQVTAQDSGPSLPDIMLPDLSEDPGLTQAVGTDEPADAVPDIAPEPAAEQADAAATASATPAPPETATTTDSAGGKPARKASALRVDPERIDRLINAVGELIINQSVISQRIAEASLPDNDEITVHLDDYKMLAREIQEGVMALRAQPVKPLFQRMLRVAREAADTTGKAVDLITEGEGTEIDKIVVERLADPLTHMVRNAIDHGIESEDDRRAAGKPERGTLRLTARQRAGTILIEIIDDGAGLNRPRILEIAKTKGIVPPDAALSEEEIDMLLFAPGFSTAKAVTNLSGRGVGMDVVKTAVTALGGRIGISSVPGQGTTFSIVLPLTLAVMDGMTVQVADQTFVVPISTVIETIRPGAQDLSEIGRGNTLLQVRGDYVPVIDLAERLGLRAGKGPLTERVLVLIGNDSVSRFALAVDTIFDQRQVVVKSMQDGFGNVPGVAGATILGDGKIALILDPDGIGEAHATLPRKIA